jgi:hypothetical protein
MRNFMVGCAVFFLAGCSNAPPSKAPEETRTEMTNADMASSLEVKASTDSVRFVLHVTNTGTQPAALEFSSAARYDFEVRTAAGQKVWRWSDDQMFAQMVGSETIPAGATRDFSAKWLPGGQSGAFIAIGSVVATNRKIEQRANFEIR